MRVLGIDCGTGKTGYGVIESDGVRHSMIASGIVATDPKDPLAVRVCAIAIGLRAVIAAHGPAAAAVEDIFHSVNAKSSLKLAHARGVALLVAAEAGLPVAEYTPMEVKISVVGYGRAEKIQVQTMVTSLLRLDGPMRSEDACDALAVAICHATRACSPVAIGAAH